MRVLTCRQMSELEVNDGSSTVILSTCGTEEDVDAELMEFLRYVENSTDEAAEVSDSDLIKRVHEKVQSVKRNRTREAEYMKLQERDQRNSEEGFAAGLQEGINALILDNLEEGVTKERIIEKLMKRFGLKREDAEKHITHFSQL